MNLVMAVATIGQCGYRNFLRSMWWSTGVLKIFNDQKSYNPDPIQVYPTVLKNAWMNKADEMILNTTPYEESASLFGDGRREYNIISINQIYNAWYIQNVSLGQTWHRMDHKQINWGFQARSCLAPRQTCSTE